MLKGLGQLGDMAGMMKKAQEMQGKMAQAQDKIAALEISGEAGAGLVQCTVNGKGVVQSLHIDPKIFSPDDKEIAEDLIIAALNDAKAKVEQQAQAEMAKITQDLPLPAGMKLPF